MTPGNPGLYFLEGGVVMNFIRQDSFVLRTISVLALGIIASISNINAAEWTMLVFVQANNNLSSYAMKNFSDMAIVGSNSNLTTLVQWHAPNQTGIWRYRIDKGKMVLDECLKEHSDGTKAEDLVNSMAWAVRKYPSQKYSLVLWNHGIGVIDPAWSKTHPWMPGNGQKISIDPAILAESPRIHLDGITQPHNARNLFDLVETSTRGILFNEHSRTYMDNQALKEALTKIKTNVLKNKKIDLLGMDACLMAMLEIAYQTRDCAEIFVGSQEVELAHGWDYHAVTSLMSTKGISAHQIGQGIVRIYENFYKNKIHFYTQSAINLGAVEQVRVALDSVVDSYRKCTALDKTLFADLARRARRSCVQFSSASYVDLHSYCNELQTLITSESNKYKTHASTDSLIRSIDAVKTALDRSIIASAAGQQLNRARGMSIYFPCGKLDYSYAKTDFALSSKWPLFVQELFA